jgi:MerR family mercuric resistance operon transcriptional regulator
MHEENNTMHGLRTGQVAKQTGVNVETLRYYERQGLIDTPPRTASGYRDYPAETVSRIRFIRRAKALGFTLQEIGDLLSLRVSPTASSAEIKTRAEAKITDIEDKIRTLTRMKETLTSITTACDGCAPLSACPILDALEAHEDGRDYQSTKPKES